MQTYILLFIVTVLVATLSLAQQPQQVTLTKEIVDNLLQVLSPACKAELEAAIESHGDISNECKMEIQGALQEFGPNGGNGDVASEGSEDGAPPQQEHAAKAPPKHWVHPAIGIAIFVVISAVGVAFAVIHINKQLGDPNAAKKPKKLSKKKV